MYISDYKFIDNMIVMNDWECWTWVQDLIVDLMIYYQV